MVVESIYFLFYRNLGSCWLVEFWFFYFEYYEILGVLLIKGIDCFYNFIYLCVCICIMGVCGVLFDVWKVCVRVNGIILKIF